YSPCPLPAAGRSTAFASSRTVTAAFVTSLPPGSFTVMRRSPVATPWANASRAQTAARNSVKQIRGIRIGFSDARILLTGLSAAQSCVKREIDGKRRFAGFYITLQAESKPDVLASEEPGKSLWSHARTDLNGCTTTSSRCQFKNEGRAGR